MVLTPSGALLSAKTSQEYKILNLLGNDNRKVNVNSSFLYGCVLNHSSHGDTEILTW